MIVGRSHLLVLALVVMFLPGVMLFKETVLEAGAFGIRKWNCSVASPESQGMIAARLEAAWADLKNRNTTAFLVIRNDRIVFERYAAGYSRKKKRITPLPPFCQKKP